VRKEIFDQKVFDDLNITPLLDLAWTLLVVFIISVTAAVQGIRVNLPKASITPSLSKASTKAISVRDDGQIYLDTFPVTMQELESLLRKYKAVTPDLPVVIKGDDKVNYGSVIEVLDLLQKLDITQLGLVTQKLVK
jgi:biopolymer transport protein ExbD